jgi:hypothetical protein
MNTFCAKTKAVEIEQVGLRLRCDLRPGHTGKDRMILQELVIFFWGDNEVRES